MTWSLQIWTVTSVRSSVESRATDCWSGFTTSTWAGLGDDRPHLLGEDVRGRHGDLVGQSHLTSVPWGSADPGAQLAVVGVGVSLDRQLARGQHHCAASSPKRGETESDDSGRERILATLRKMCGVGGVEERLRGVASILAIQRVVGVRA